MHGDGESPPQAPHAATTADLDTARATSGGDAVPVDALTQAAALRHLAESSAALLDGAGAPDMAARLVDAATQTADIVAVIEQIPEGVLVADGDGHAVLVNAAWRRMWGTVALNRVEPVPVQVTRAYNLRDPATGRPLTSRETPLARALAGETVRDAEFLSRTPGQSSDRWTRASSAPHRAANGRVVGAVALFTDVTAERRLARDLAAAAARLRTVYTAALCGLMIVDRAGTIHNANDTARAILGLPPAGGGDPAAHLSDWDLRTPDGRALLPSERPGVRALVSGEPQHEVLVQLAGRVELDAEPRWLQIDAVPVAEPDGVAEQAVVSFVEVTERVQTEQRLAHQALHDALTGLPNRTLLHDRVEHAILHAARDHQPLALLLLDLDRFKEVNDTLGHHHGDLLLGQVARRLRGALRATDTVARLGGDEFAALVPHADEAVALRAARAIQRALTAPLTIEGQQVDVGASVGVALGPVHGSDAPTLLRHADVALYVAKRKRGSVAVYDRMQDQRGTPHLGLLSDLRRALATDALDLYYQPVVATADGRAVGVEALLRWPHPERGMIAPEQFIPLAEQTDLITPLTGWALKTALRQLQVWREAGLELGVAVNLSMRTLLNARLPATIADLLRQFDIAPGRLTLEITETALMHDEERAAQMLVRLRDLGVRMAIDDFGTGYSSLGYLKQLPVDAVKIDRSFVQGMSVDGHTGSTRDAALVRSIIAMAHALGLSVVAEGVETPAAWRLLRMLECEEGQGYHLGRPMRPADLVHWLQASPWAVA